MCRQLFSQSHVAIRVLSLRSSASFSQPNFRRPRLARGLSDHAGGKLPNSSVTAITQTEDGYLWSGTYDDWRGLTASGLSVRTAGYAELKNARIRRLYTTRMGFVDLRA